MIGKVAPFFVAVGPEPASEQYVRLAADPSLAGVSGMYFVSGKERKEASSPLSLDPVVQQQINDTAEAWAAPFLRGRAPSLHNGTSVNQTAAASLVRPSKDGL